MANSTKPIKQLYLSDKDKKLAGVCGGIAEYFDADPTLVRLAWVVMTVATGIAPGIIAYIVMAIITPAHGDNADDSP